MKRLALSSPYRRSVAYTCLLCLGSVLVLGCTDPQFDFDGDGGFLLVAPSAWSTRYGPGLDVVVPFPTLSEHDGDVTFESSDRSIVDAAYLEGSVRNDPFRGVHLQTLREGSVEIRLRDASGQLVRTEFVYVVSPSSVELQVIKPEAAPNLGYDDGFAYLLTRYGRGEAVVRYYGPEGNEVVTSTSVVSYSDVTLKPTSSDAVYLINGGQIFERTPHQLTTGDEVVLHSGIYNLLVQRADRRAQMRSESPRLLPSIDEYEVLVEPGVDLVSIAVFGKSNELPDVRFVGLAPEFVAGPEAEVQVLRQFPWHASARKSPEVLEVRINGFVDTVDLSVY